MMIYLITNLINGKWYVGQTIRPLEHRWERHLHVGKKDAKYHLYKSMKKYGIENFKIQKIEECYTTEELDYLEKYYIKMLHSNNETFGYNLTDGGAGTHSHKVSDEAREKMRQAKLGNKIWVGRKHSEETKEKIRLSKVGKPNNQLGRKRSEESKQKMRLAKLNKKLSLEHIENIRRASSKRIHTEETKKKMSEQRKGIAMPEEQKQKHIGNKSRTGMPHSPETIQKMKDAWKRRKESQVNQSLNKE